MTEPEYQVACPECRTDSGDLTFESAKEAIEFFDEPGECANCGEEVELIPIKREVE